MKILRDVAAPAKLNLFLHIVGRRSDGYHLIQSAFMLLNWCDWLHFEKTQSSAIEREDLTMILPRDDLVMKAARSLQQAASVGCGAHIAIEKRLPAQAGLGGGSSDAASTLLALNRLWDINWPIHKLIELGVMLGADVPFFLAGQHAWVEGIGEHLTPVELPKATFVILKPNQGLSTPAIFSDAGLERSCKTVTISDFAADPYDFGRNVLQPVAERLCPSVSEALNWLRLRGLHPRMTGSGSAVFALLPESDAFCNSLAKASLPEGWQLKVCSNLESHPLLGWASSDS
jgi:4-diphosphocytidyl-2-C-methyl-D-erythritol kinase